MARVKIAEGWEADVDGAVANLFESRLGPDISDDARRYCPVRTGALKASIEYHLEGRNLIVSATGGGEDAGGNMFVYRRQDATGNPTPPLRLSDRAARLVHPSPGRNVGSLVTRRVHHIRGDDGGHMYAAYVELGHRVYHPSTGMVGPGTVAPRPFLRPALYTARHG